jgi:hypothetical protein
VFGKSLKFLSRDGALGSGGEYVERSSPSIYTHRFGPDEVVSGCLLWIAWMHVTTWLQSLLILVRANYNRPRLWAWDSREVCCCLKACQPRRCTVLCMVM